MRWKTLPKNMFSATGPLRPANSVSVRIDDRALICDVTAALSKLSLEVGRS
jgi:hypothetical protein